MFSKKYWKDRNIELDYIRIKFLHTTLSSSFLSKIIIMYNNIKNIFNNSKSCDLVGKPYLLAKTSLRTTDWGKSFKFLNNLEEPIDFEIKKIDEHGVYHIRNILSSSQCKHIIGKAEKLNLQFCCYGEERNNSRLVLFDKAFAKHLWNVISEPLKNVLGDEKICPFGFDVTRGEWSLSGINEAMRLNRYSGKHKEHFAPHRDAPFCPNGDKRSLYTVLIYLNDDFLGGETVFHFPKNLSVDLKGLTIQEEFQIQGSVFTGFKHLTFSPKTGHAVVFKQNLIHEGCLLNSNGQYKFVIKTDIMVERLEKLGFSPGLGEQENFFHCLNLFREAQQHELAGDGSKSNECYERSLSIRYSYPDNDLGKTITENLENRETNFIFVATENDVKSTTDSIQFNQATPKSSTCLIFPLEIWHRIMMFVGDYNSLENLCKVFPFLRGTMKDILFGSVVPDLVHHSGVFTQFLYQDIGFASGDIDSLARVAAVYSIFLLGNTPMEKHYLVNYDKEERKATSVELRDLLYGVFTKEPVHGTIFKVEQQNMDSKEPERDFYHSVDRQFMATHFNREDLGIDIDSELRSNVKILSKTISEYAEDRDTFYKDYPIKERDFLNRKNFNQLDRFYEACHHDVPRESPDDCYNNLGANDYNLARIDDDYEIFGEITEEEDLKTLLEYNRTLHVPSGAVVRRMDNPTTITKEDNYCTCFMFRHVGGKLSRNCSTHVFNHVVADFSRIKLNVRTADPDTDKTSYMFRNLKKWSNHFCDSELFDYKLMCVDISELEGVVSSFNHAACQCAFPDHRIEDYVTLSNYPMLEKIYVFLARSKKGEESESGKTFVFTGYGGIVAL